MLLLVTKAEASLSEFSSEHLGRLATPRHFDSRVTERVHAADNDCFNGLNADQYTRMIDSLTAECLWVTVPDVVGDHEATLKSWETWAKPVHDRGLSSAFVLQDGITSLDEVPPTADALFIGGTTEFKLGPDAKRITKDAVDQGYWVHMGRVNSRKRIRYAHSIGCSSVDGSSFSMFTNAHVPWALELLEELG